MQSIRGRLPDLEVLSGLPTTPGNELCPMRWTLGIHHHHPRTRGRMPRQR